MTHLFRRNAREIWVAKSWVNANNYDVRRAVAPNHWRPAQQYRSFYNNRTRMQVLDAIVQRAQMGARRCDRGAYPA